MVGVRRLTPTECTRLQGFPDTWYNGVYGTQAERDTVEILHCLWRSTYTWAREGWGSGESIPFFAPEILLAGVYGGWISWEVAGECANRARALSGEKPWTKGFVCRLWEARENRSSPYRRESFEQLARELDRSLSELPLEETQAIQEMLNRGMQPETPQGWPVRPSLPAQEERQISDSVKYRQLGNAVAVPVVEWIGKRLAEMGGSR